MRADIHRAWGLRLVCAALLLLGLGAVTFLLSRPPRDRWKPIEAAAPVPMLVGESMEANLDPLLGGGDDEPEPPLRIGVETRAPAVASPGAMVAVPAVRVRIVAESEPWLDAASTSGMLRWNDGTGQAPGADDDLFRFQCAAQAGALVGVVELPAVPASHGEFMDVSLAGLPLKAASLRSLTRSVGTVGGEPPGPWDFDACDFELSVEWPEGPTLVWSDTVGHSEQVLVSVCIGGAAAPAARSVPGSGAPRKLGQVRRGIELPFRLPQLNRPLRVWVGASGYAWRSFSVQPNDQEVKVALGPAAAIRVLYDPPTTTEKQQLFVSTFPRANLERKPASAAGETKFTERPVAVHQVWMAEIGHGAIEPVSRVARVQLVAGETALVDLTSEYAARNMGGMRVRVLVSPETLEAAGEGLTVRAMRLAPEGAARAWEHAGELARVTAPELGGEVFELVGAQPGLHRFIAEPLGNVVAGEVVAGEVGMIDIQADDFGWFELALPPGQTEQLLYAYVTTAETEGGDRSFVFRLDTSDLEASERTLLATGRYTAHATFGPRPLVTTESDVFEVQKGSTTLVQLRVQPKVSVSVEARDELSGKLILLERDLWREIAVVGTRSGKRHRGSTSYAGRVGVFSSIRWQLPEIDELVEIRIPGSSLWEFAALEPMRLRDGDTIVLLARRKN